MYMLTEVTPGLLLPGLIHGLGITCGLLIPIHPFLGDGVTGDLVSVGIHGEIHGGDIRLTDGGHRMDTVRIGAGVLHGAVVRTTGIIIIRIMALDPIIIARTTDITPIYPDLVRLIQTVPTEVMRA